MNEFGCRVHVVFGHVIEGKEVVTEIERQKVDENSRPLSEVQISSCGELVLQVRPKGKVYVRCKMYINLCELLLSLRRQ